MRSLTQLIMILHKTTCVLFLFFFFGYVTSIPNNGKQLRVGVPIRVSFRQFVSKSQETNVYKGFCIDVFTAAMDLLPYPIPYKFIPFGDGKTNPSYTELVNSITTGVFDAVVGDIAIVTNRTKIVDFTQPFATSGLVIVAPFRKSNSGAWVFLQPFSWPMWIVTCCFFIVVGIVVWILKHRTNDEFRGPPQTQIKTVLWFSFSTLFSTHKENIGTTLARIVLIIWLFVVLIISSSYTASLTSILTVQQLSSSIKGIETLKESNQRIGYQTGSFAEYYLNEELGIPKSRLVELGSPKEYVDRLLRGPENGGVAAIVDELPYAEVFLSSHCEFKLIGQQFRKIDWGFAFPRGSQLAINMSTAILLLAENGDLQRIHDKWLKGRACSSDTSEIKSDRLELKSFSGLFIICGIVFFGSLVIYFFYVRRLYRATPAESVSPAQGSSQSGRLQELQSDEKHYASRNSKQEILTENVPVAYYFPEIVNKKF